MWLFILSVIFLSFIILACQNNEEIDVPIENTIEHRIDQVFDEIKLPESTMSNLTLKNVSLKEPNAQINWISDNQVIITNQGEVRRKEVDHEVELTAIVSLEGKILSRVFKVVVRSVDSFQLPIEAYKSDYGYASMVISNRMNQTNIAQVHNEVEFLDALKDKSNHFGPGVIEGLNWLEIRKLYTETRNYAATLLGRVRTGFAHFNRITVENSEVHTVVPSAKYSGGLIGGAETNTKVLMNDVYVNGLTLTHTQSDMFGVIIGRVRSHFELTNAVVHNVVLNGRHNLGLVVGKEENTTTLISITNFFGEDKFNFQPDASGIYFEYYGYVAGNSDAGKITTSRFYAVAIENFGRSKGNNSYTELIESIEVADELWWQTKLSPMYESPYWEYNEGVLKIK